MKNMLEEYGRSIITAVVCIVMIGLLFFGVFSLLTVEEASLAYDVGLNNGKIYVAFNESENTLIFTNTDQYSGYKACSASNRYGELNQDEIAHNKANRPWDSITNNIHKVEIANEIKPYTMVNWFTGLSYVTEFSNLNNIDTSDVTSFENTFYQCPQIENINISLWHTENVGNYTKLFADCFNLDAIQTGSRFVKKDGAVVTDMFKNCYDLSEHPEGF